jgi:hypothetical protein
MSSSDAAESGTDTCRIELATDQPGVQFSIRDSEFRTVARGLGVLSVNLPAGLYQVDRRAGDAVDSEIVALRPGALYAPRTESLPLPTVAPVAYSSTARPEYTAAVEEASTWVPAGSDAALVVVVCRPGLGARHVLTNWPARSMPHARDPDSSDAGVTLLDGRLESVEVWRDGWRIGANVASWAAALEPGGYVLRVEGGIPSTLDHSVWLEPGWQTIVFCVYGDDGAHTGMSTHLCRIGQRWRATDPANTALETALSGLRLRRCLFSASQAAELMADDRTVNPMLGIVGAHALRLVTIPDHDAYDRLVDRLTALVPNHPDVLALSLLRGGRIAPDGQRIWWPPALVDSYRDLLLPADLVDEEVVVDGSLADRVAANLVLTGAWLGWLPLSGDGFTPELPPTSRAVERIERYLDQVARLHDTTPAGIVRHWDTGQIAAATGIPMATVRQTLAARYPAGS